MLDVGAAADALIRARREGGELASLPGGAMPTSLAEAYAIQDAIIERSDEPLAGWKVAFTSPESQRKVGASEPAAGPIFASAVRASPATIAMPDTGLRITECEFAFRIGADLPEQDTPYTERDVAVAIAAVHPAIEVVDVSFRDKVAVGALGIIADHCGNRGFVHGPGIEQWQRLDLAGHEIRHFVDGVERARGSGAAVMGNPLAAVVWLANHLRERGRRLRAGEWVSSGLCTEMLRVPAGGTAVGDFGALGTVEVRFAP